MSSLSSLLLQLWVREVTMPQALEQARALVWAQVQAGA